jgi:two-component system sensor histidine kinase KdpD
MSPWRILLCTTIAGLIVCVLVVRSAVASPVFAAASLVVCFLLTAAVGALERQRLAATVDATRSAVQADRMRAALLAAVSHDRRSPLAAAKAAVSCLRSRDIELTVAERYDLLATADDSLDVLSSLGPAAQKVLTWIPPGLPEVMADPPIMERVIANVTANALRYSSAGSPPLLTASARGDRVELRVVDRGPGVPEADRDQIFAPFQRLGEPGSISGVGLGLAMSRGLIEAMRGTLDPQEAPGGGLTMTISIPAAPARSSWSPSTAQGRDGVLLTGRQR